MWTGYRKFTVDRIVPETASAKSFYLIPHDGKPLASYHPGQHLLFRLTLPGHKHPLLRFYTLSDCFHNLHYRITVKKESPPIDHPGAPSGLGSSYLHDVVKVGDILEAKAPAGDFFLDMQHSHPVVFIAGGIGVTPLHSMLNAVVQHQPSRIVYFLFALRNGGDHVFKQHLRAITDRHPNIHMLVCYDEARSDDIPGIDYDHAGRVDIALLQRFLPKLDLPYYLCGPNPMMVAITQALQQAGVAASQIHTESFGPASTAYRDVNADEHAQATQPLTIKFAKSHKSIAWEEDCESILQLAQSHDIPIDAGCLFGDCATCMTRLLEGDVQYNHPTAVTADPGTCLPCSCKPKTSITLDA